MKERYKLTTLLIMQIGVNIRCYLNNNFANEVFGLASVRINEVRNSEGVLYSKAHHTRCNFVACNCCMQHCCIVYGTLLHATKSHETLLHAILLHRVC